MNPFPMHDCFDNRNYPYGRTLCGMGGGPARAAKTREEVTCKSCIRSRNLLDLKKNEGTYNHGAGI